MPKFFDRYCRFIGEKPMPRYLACSRATRPLGRRVRICSTSYEAVITRLVRLHICSSLAPIPTPALCLPWATILLV